MSLRQSARQSVSPASERIPSGLQLVQQLSEVILKDMSMFTAHVLFLQTSVSARMEETTQALASSPTSVIEETVRGIMALQQQVRDVRWATMVLCRHAQKLVHVIHDGHSAVFVVLLKGQDEDSTSMLVQDLLRNARVDDILRGIDGARAAVWEMKRFFEGKEGSSNPVRAASNECKTSSESDQPASGWDSDSSSDRSLDLTSLFDPRAAETKRALSGRNRGHSDSSRSSPESAHIRSPTLRMLSGAGSSLRRVFRRKQRAPIPFSFRPTREAQRESPISTLIELEEHLPVAYTEQSLPLLQTMDRHLEQLQEYWKEWGIPRDGHWVVDEEGDTVVLRGSWVKREWNVSGDLVELEERLKDLVQKIKAEGPQIPFQPL